MKKLTLLTSEFPPFRGGVGVLADQLAQAASDLGAYVKVIAPDYLTNDWQALDPARGYHVVRYKAGPYSGLRMPVYLRQAIIAGRDPEAGRLIAVDGPFLEAMALTRALHRKRFDAVLHGSEIARASRSRLRRLIGVRNVFSAPERFFANSHFTRNLLLDEMPFIDPNSVMTTYPAANSAWFTDPNNALIRDLVPPATERLVICTGRITLRKGQLTLMQALQSAPLDEETRKSLTVVIAGRASESDRDYFVELQRSAELARPIRTIIRDDLTDDQIRALYSQADLFCLPGSAKTNAVEGFGLVLIEAAAQGLPSVAGAVGAVSETVLHGETGILVPPDDVAALGNVLADLLTDRSRLNAMKPAARAHAAKFSWTAFAKPILDAA